MTSRGVLVTGQIAVASLLLFLSILVLRSLHFIREVDPGFSIDEVITARVDLDQVRYPADARLRFAAEALEAARAVPGVDGWCFETPPCSWGAASPSGHSSRSLSRGPWRSF